MARVLIALSQDEMIILRAPERPFACLCLERIGPHSTPSTEKYFAARGVSNFISVYSWRSSTSPRTFSTSGNSYHPGRTRTHKSARYILYGTGAIPALRLERLWCFPQTESVIAVLTVGCEIRTSLTDTAHIEGVEEIEPTVIG